MLKRSIFRTIAKAGDGRNISRKAVTGFYQNPLGRFDLENVEIK